MSEIGGFGLNFVEKIFGLIVLVAGILSAYYTFTSFQALGDFVGFFGFLSIILIVIGFVLMTAKTEE